MAVTLGNTEAVLSVGRWKIGMVVLTLPHAKQMSSPSLFLVIITLLSNSVVGP